MNISSSYGFFGTYLSFTTNTEPCYQQFQEVFGYFQTPAPRIDITCAIEKTNSAYQVTARSKRYSLQYTMETPPHTDTYLSLFGPVIYEVKDFFLIHAGSLNTPGGKSIFISAPCGFGKTTLTRELIAQGFKLLSDELAPVSLETGLIYPYPRGMGVLAGSGKKIVAIPQDIIGEKCRPGYVIFLTLRQDPPHQAIRYMEIALGRIDNDLVTGFRNLAGVQQVTRIHDRLFPMLRLLLTPDTIIVPRIQALCHRNNIPIIYTLKGKTRAPDYQAPPQIQELSSKQGVFELSQHILNAHNSALLEETFAGSRPRMIFELAGLMNQARFFNLTVGKLPQMVNLVKKICLSSKK